MKLLSIIIFLMLLSLLNIGCQDNTAIKIRKSLSHYFKDDTTGNNKELKFLLIDSISYILIDSTVYYNHFLDLLSQRSETYARMAKLRTSLARAHMDSFLTKNKNDDYLQYKNKSDLDNNLEALKNNEREWNRVNDSMDLMLNAIHLTDTTIKVFYKVSYFLKAMRGEDKLLPTPGTAIMNINDYKVIFVE